MKKDNQILNNQDPKDGDSRPFERVVIPQANNDLFGEVPIRSISFNETEIIKNIIYLYLDNKSIELDPTYSTGNFYKGLTKPKLKYDIEPQCEGVLQSDCRSLPLDNSSTKSIMYDPPFICGIPREAKPGIIKARFGYYKNVPELWEFYANSLKEFYRILKNDGVLIVKCQDTVDSSKQYLSHIFLVNEASRLGFYARDLFVYAVKDRIIDPNIKNQQHARKFHSYFLVFEKKKVKINYGLAV